MRRLEHSEIVEACKAAIQQIVDDPANSSFGRDDVANKVLEVHPELDRAQVESVAAKCLRAMEWPSEAQVAADCEEAKRHAATLPREEAVAYLERKEAELREMGEAQLVEGFYLMIGSRVLQPYGDEASTGDIVKRIGADAFVAAVKEELRRDGHAGNVVTIPAGERDVVIPMDEFLNTFRVEAEDILNPGKRRKKVTFYFPTGPEQAA